MLEPSPLLIISVLTPYCRAVAMIDDSVPPAEREMYQIHIPRPASESAALWITCARVAFAVATPCAFANASPASNSPTSRATMRPRCSVIRPATNATVA